jgi:hypothetical protein
VSSSLYKAWARLSRITWDEFRTRLGQEVGKRAEHAFYRAGLLPSLNGIRSQSSDAGKFFFSADEMPGRVALLKRRLPIAVEETVGEANEILQHKFRLLGYRDLDYGPEIDWHLDAVHGKRTALKPWYKIRFLDFAEAGDHKITWELNRHQHLVTLAKAWAFTGEEKYVQEFVRQFYSWQSANPYPMGINWGSSLEVAFRSLSWLWVRSLSGQSSGHRSGKSSSLPASFNDDLLRALERNGQYIERYLSTYFSPNTHLIGEAVALFFVGTLCPQIPAARRWQQKGLAIVLAEAQRQVRPDGVYFEQSLYYHVYALDFFLHTRALAARNDIAVPEAFDRVLEKMLDVVRLLSRNGPPEGFGDDDGGRVFNPQRNHAEHMADPLALGAALYGSDPLRQSRALTEEAIWLFGENALRTGGEHIATLSSEAFQEGGLYLIASPGKSTTQMLVDAGPHGIGNGGHGHADALSVRLSINRRRWLVDAGSHVYISPRSEQERNQFRGTAAHNTVRVDKLDQAVPEGPFSWSSLPEVSAEQWVRGSGFTLFSGSHTGYRRLPDPVLHRRTIFHLHGEYFLVRDVMEGPGMHDLEIFWHFAPGLKLAASENTLIADSEENDAMALLTAGTAEWVVAAEQGFVSPAYGVKQSAAVAACRIRTQLPVELATLLTALEVGKHPGRLQLATPHSNDRAVYIHERGELTDYVIFGKSGGRWAFGRFRSDAVLFFARLERGEVISLIFSLATFADMDGRQLFSSPQPVARFEWTRVDGPATSNPKSPKFFDEEVLRPRTAVP